jgi:aminoglycoside phosphotransferase family enzyme
LVTWSSKGVADTSPAGVTLADKVRFLSSPGAFGEAGISVEVVETHMSLIFMVGDRAYKIKKPIRLPFADFSTLEARKANCQAEIELNRRLAPEVYLRVAPLTLAPTATLALDGDGPEVEWVVVMRRLPNQFMLDHLLATAALIPEDVNRLAAFLARFYRRADRPDVSPPDYFARLLSEQAVNREILTRRTFAVDHGRVPLVLDRMDAVLRRNRPLLEARAAGHRLVDGHGDLRPEHICLTADIVIFDCLEFDARLRLVDPVDELAFLAMECELLGAPWLGTALWERISRELGDEAPVTLFDLHFARRAMLRAQLTLAHLLDPAPRQPEKWEPLAARYLALAEQALARLGQG